MNLQKYNEYIKSHADVIEKIANYATNLHDVEVNQKYGNKPYSVHLTRTANIAATYLPYMLEDDMENTILPVIFAAWFHDSIEDARLTYHDVVDIAKGFGFTAYQYQLAGDIVYALTNNKGKTRKERANAAYYEYIMGIPFATFCKYCDRMANLQLSLESDGSSLLQSIKKHEMYVKESEHFVKSLTQTDPHSIQIENWIPSAMRQEYDRLLTQSPKIVLNMDFQGNPLGYNFSPYLVSNVRDDIDVRRPVMLARNLWNIITTTSFGNQFTYCVCTELQRQLDIIFSYECMRNSKAIGKRTDEIAMQFSKKYVRTLTNNHHEYKMEYVSDRDGLLLEFTKRIETVTTKYIKAVDGIKNEETRMKEIVPIISAYMSDLFTIAYLTYEHFQYLKTLG